MSTNGTMEITTMIGCAVNCKFCPQKKLISRYKELSNISLMSLDSYKICIDKMPSDVSIHFSGFCEPWQNKKCTDMLLYAYRKGHELEVFTTLQHVTKEDIQIFKHIPIRKFIIHLPDRQGHSKIRINEKYWESLKYMVEYFKGSQRNIFFGFSCHGVVDPDVEQIIPTSLYNHPNYLGVHTEIHDRAGSLDIDEVGHRYLDGRITCGLCGTKLNRNVLLPNGSVALCCMDYELKHVLGNLISESYEDLYTSKRFDLLQIALEDEQKEILCRYCVNARKIIPEQNLVLETIKEESDIINENAKLIAKQQPFKGKFEVIKNILNNIRDYIKIKKSGLFDISFYLNNNNDVKENDANPILHFVQHGWREGRNPSDVFDTNYYLEKNLDVKLAGLNPLIHYINYGIKEGRKIHPSCNIPLALENIEISSCEHPDHSKIILGLVVMVRDEQDILPTFLNHIDALFDYVLLIDHRSIDDSSKILKNIVERREGWTYILADIYGFHQEAISDLSMSILFSQNVDYVFFLDCDEFIQVRDRNTLIDMVNKLSNPPRAGSLHWVNGVIHNLSSFNFRYRSSIWINSDESQYSKVVIPKSIFDKNNGDIHLTHGNHQVLDSKKLPIESIKIGEILHFPIRSKQQLIKKSIISALSNIANVRKNPGNSFQYFKMLEVIAKDQVSEDIVRGCIYLYEKESAIIPLSISDLISKNYRKSSLKMENIASSARFNYRIDKNACVSIEKMVANYILSMTQEVSGILVYDQIISKISMKSDN